MRLLSLHLDRYGAFTDHRVVFRQDRPLTIVLGPNEAGKSTALAALSDAFFGFPAKPPHAFLHDYQALRVGVEIAARDGRRLAFRRRKGNKATLLDADDKPIDDGALRPFLGTIDRALFEEAFALDQASLRKGAERLISGDGSLGEALVSAAPGLGLLVDVRRQTGTDAAALFDPERRHRSKPLYAALDRFEETRTNVRKASLTADAVQRAKSDLDRAIAALADIDAERRRLRIEAERVRRLRAALPHLERRRALETEAERFAAVPRLPDGFAETLAAANARIERSAATLAERRLEQEAATTLLAGLQPEEALIAESVAIDRLAQDRRRRELADRERAAETERVAETDRDLAERARRLGLADADALLRLRPTAVQEQRLRGLLAENRTIQGRRAAAADALAAARQSIQTLADDGDRDHLADPAEHRAVLEVLAGLPPAARTAAQRAAAALSARRDLRDALIDASLPDTPDAVDAVRLPERAEAESARQAEEEAQRAVQTATRLVAEAADRLHQVEARQAALSGEAPVPSEAAVAAARTARHKAWLAVRAVVFAEVDPPTFERLHLVHALERSTDEADALADRRLVEADRVALAERIALDRKAAETALQAARDGETAAKARLAETVAGWTAHLRSIGAPAMTPQEALSARTRLDVCLLQLSAFRAREQEATAARDELADLRRTLATLAGRIGITPDPDDDLGTLARVRTAIAAAEDAFRAARDRALARRAAEARLQEAQRLTDDLAALEAELAARIAEHAPALGLPVDATPEDAEVALGVWAELPEIMAARSDAAARLARTDAFVESFDAEADRLTAALDPALALQPSADRIARLSDRLREARDIARRRRHEGERLQRLDRDAAEAEMRAAEARQSRDSLLQEAGIPLDADIPSLLRDAAEAESLRLRIAEVRAALLVEAAGRTEETIAAELADADPDVLAAEAAALAERLTAIDAEHEAAVAARTAADAAYREIIGREGAEALGQEAENALSAVLRLADEWALLQAANRLAGAVVEEFRKRHQSPVLAEAGRMFASLTDGRYPALAGDYDEAGKVRLVALRDDGRRLDPTALSEGTRDQLYLALRLATLAEHARGAEPLPFVGDDLFVTFDDARTRRGLLTLADYGATTQAILFTHHAHVAEIAREALRDRVDVIDLERR